MIIALGYKKQTGKDSFYKIVSESFPDVKFVRCAFADPLKEEVWDMYRDVFDKHGWNKEDYLSESNKHITRPIWIAHGTIMRAFDSMYWANKNKDKCLALIKENPQAVLVVTDMRYLNETDVMREIGAIQVHTVRDAADDGEVHSSETELDGYTGWDHELDNNGSYDEYVPKVVALYSYLGKVGDCKANSPELETPAGLTQ